MEGENRLYTVLSVAGGFFCLAAALLLGSPLAAGAGAFFFFLSLALWKYGHAFVPALLRGAGISEVGMNFEIPPGQEVVVGMEGGLFLATAYLSARLYESSSGKGARASEMFERAVSSLGFPFRLCAQVSPLDLRGELDEMRAKRSIAESRLGRLQGRRAKSPEAARLEREIAMWSRQIESIGSGQVPLEVLFVLSTTASGATKEEAVALAGRQADGLSVAAGSALSCEVVRLRGEDLKRCFSWDFFGPPNAEKLHDELF